MTDPGGDGARTSAELEGLPITRGITFRGVPQDTKLPDRAAVMTSLTTTSRDPRVASENFTHPLLLAIVTRTGRDLSDLTGNAAEAEVAILPGVTLMPVAQIKLKQVDLVVRLVEELDASRDAPDNTGLPATLEEFMDQVSASVLAAYRNPPLTLASPGKFAGELG